MSDTDTAPVLRNGIDLTALGELAAEITARHGPVPLSVRTEHRWTEAARVEGHGSSVSILGQVIDRTHHRLSTDLPLPLGGHDSSPAPTEVLLAALAGCVVSGLAEQAAFEGVDITRVDVATETTIDARGVFGVDGVAVAPSSVTVELTIHGASELEQLEALARTSLELSPTVAALTQPITVHLVVREP